MNIIKLTKERAWKAKKSFLNSRLVRKISDVYETARNKTRNRIIEPVQKGWSIVVVTGGNANESLSALVRSAENELLASPAEIIIVGPKNAKLDFVPKIKVIFFEYQELGLAPGWITRKKNLGVKMCSYDKVAVCHDYIVFKPGWKKGFDEFGDDFEVCVNMILNRDGNRFRDWITWDYPGIGPGLLPYSAKCNEYQIISGTFFIVKRDFFISHPLDEKLRWGEGEDAEWSMRVRKITDFKLNRNSAVSFSKLKIGVHGNWLENTENLKKIFTPEYD
jgi:hypothetical protein